MKNIDYNNISYEQLREILPPLQVSYFFGITDPEILLSLFPVWDEYEDHIIEHVICAYSKDNSGNLIVRPLGTMDSGNPADGFWIEYECLHECVCLATGRFDGGNKIVFSTIQGYLPFTESKEYMPCEIQAAGEAVLSKFYGDCNFSHANIGGRNYLTTDHANGDNNSNPFSTVKVIGPPAF